MCRKLKICAVLLASLAVMGCETMHFYGQAVWGQLKLLHARVPVSKLQGSEKLDPEIRARLTLAQDILSFAETRLGLEQDGRYTSYVQLERDHVVWNVFAAAPYSLAGKQWCYPLVGCAPYRGYFSQADALDAANDYVEQGFETYVGGVPAYSTLGWFEDPLLSTFILWPEADLANLLMHEIAHNRIWVVNDTTFNESFAEFVGNQGARAWLDQRNQKAVWESWLSEREGWRAFRRFVVQAKAYLGQIYEIKDQPRAKNLALTELQVCYGHNRANLGDGRFDKLMQNSFNNAFLVSIGTYTDWIPGFQAVYFQAQGDWPAFYAAVDELAAMGEAQRTLELGRLTQQQVSHNADDQNAHEINCQPFLSHRFH